MTMISPDQRAMLRERIEAAESRTSAEFVTIIARAAEPYLFIPTLFAAVATLLMSGVALFFQATLLLTLIEFFAGQVIVFTVLALIFRIPEIRFALVPRSIRHARASRLARYMFLELGLTETEDRNAVLFFVATGESYVEVIADVGLQARLSDSAVWDRIIATFVEDVREGNIAEGYARAIDGCADVMAEHFPNRDGAPNRFPDRLIEI
jgi:putative membrane protein